MASRRTVEDQLRSEYAHLLPAMQRTLIAIRNRNEMNRKAKLLQDAEYRYNYDRLAYVNRDAKKVFAVEAINDHSEEWLASRIEETNPSSDWRFYEEPPLAIRRALIAALDGQPADR